jgi:tetratricopeptide (TPR) repeat protein
MRRSSRATKPFSTPFFQMKALFYAPWAAGVLWGIALFAARPSFAQTVTPLATANDIRIESIEGRVEVNRGGNTQWLPVLPGHGLKPGDRVRTLERSSVSIRWSDQSRVRLPELSNVQIQASTATQRTSFSLITGLLYFFNRERLTNARYGTQNASAAIRGTEFVLQAEENRTTLTVIEGEVELSNEVEPALTLRTGEQGVAEPGQAPRKTPAIIVNNVIQWALYYPAVLDVDELGLTLAERNRLATSMAAYKSGELLRALDLLPAAAAAESSAEKIYRAGLLLAVGNVAEAEQVLSTVAQTAGAATAAPRSLRLADALRTLIAAVKLQPSNTNSSPELASEWLAESYSHQSRGDLPGALRATRKSVEISADFGFGWTRVAELEFSFGHTSQAHEALERGLLYAPRNAQSLALKGFVLAAQNRISEAISWFNRAITVDANLANAWLGRGLCLIRQGHSQRGREDLLTAVVMEPQRAILRSYLAKAYTDAGDEKRATHELQIAKDIDPNDPTAWLYSALLNEQENRINDAVRDLEKSQELTGNRYIYRSGLSLDQDRAVRSANLARVYQDAGMFDVAIREASRAVSYDYANYSSHLFLANALNLLVDPSAASIRFQTPKRIEYLLANLLAPVGGGILSPIISEQEYSKLFERDRLGVVSRTEYLSRGAWAQSAGQFGTYANSSYSVEAYYQSDPGQRPNNDFEQTEYLLHFKQQLSPADTIYGSVSFTDSETGDLAQRYDPSVVDPDFRFKVNQEPLIVLGYHRQWHPGSHTLLMGTIYKDRIRYHDLARNALIVSRTNGVLEGVPQITMDTHVRQERVAYGAEAQHILSGLKYQTVVGARYVWGDSDVHNLQENPSDFGGIYFPEPPEPAAVQDETLKSDRFSTYVYQQLELHNSLHIFAGLTYDDLRFPANPFDAPVSSEETSIQKWSPKAGVIWLPMSNSVVRFAYSQSLLGAAVDQSLLIEPSQVAGFTQIYRSIFPESAVGSVPGTHAEIFGLSLEQKIGQRTFLGLFAEILSSDAERTRGVFDLFPFELGFAIPGSLQERLDYRERSVTLTANQLLGEEWSFGLRYRLSEAELDTVLPEITPEFASKREVESLLHQFGAHVGFTHPSGFFGQIEGLWYSQSNRGYDPAEPGDSFWHLNALVGYRLYRRKIEIAGGILNVLDQDYRLSPLNLHPDLPRERTLVARLSFAF